ncbi:unnamed protein product [Prorocentrum cordatum]|uniref:Transporter n=1 Tax=Prorocentrum cordatum TaxID=2364126 RepID=A0ABN9QV06_9DINO|nr:unnamed protein product [Polarella glacialis]
MAMAGCRAAPVAAELLGAAAAAPSPWPVRRARQAAACGAVVGRLAAALQRALELETRVEGLALRHAVAAGEAAALVAARAALVPDCGVAAAASGNPEPKVAAAELVERLALVAPVLDAGVRETGVIAMEVGGRNVACHHPALPAAAARAMPQRELNRVQQEARRAGGGDRQSSGDGGCVEVRAAVDAQADTQHDAEPATQPAPPDDRGGELEGEHGDAAMIVQRQPCGTRRLAALVLREHVVAGAFVDLETQLVELMAAVRPLLDPAAIARAPAKCPRDAGRVPGRAKTQSSVGGWAPDRAETQSAADDGMGLPCRVRTPPLVDNKKVSDVAGDPPLSPASGGSSLAAAQERPTYASKVELMLSLVGYAVGLGNVWRFPYLAFSNGGGGFLIPYTLALVFLGLPLFVLELGLGQMLRQGTLGVWRKLGVPRLQCVGMGATLVTFFVSLYYNVILAWTVYYIGRTIASFGGPLPWSDEIEGFQCKEQVLIVAANMTHLPLIVESTGLFNQMYKSAFWCPEKGIPDATTEVPPGYVRLVETPKQCPAQAAAQFWEEQVLWQSSGMDDLGGFHPGMVVSFTIAWILVYGCICKGVASSGKVVYVTATLPYVALVAFSFRANSLPNAAAGIYFFVKPDFKVLLDTRVWLRAVTQIFYSLGVGFGSIIAFASYGPVSSNFPRDAGTVSLINCGTSIFAGFVVFPILGFLALELSETDPCIDGSNLEGLESVGISGTGLAFIAFPIAISQMAGSSFWAMLFFVMLFCLGIDSQFAMCESVITVLSDAGADKWLTRRLGCQFSKGRFVFLYCAISYMSGLIFCTRAGVYWFNLFGLRTIHALWDSFSSRFWNARG